MCAKDSLLSSQSRAGGNRILTALIWGKPVAFKRWLFYLWEVYYAATLPLLGAINGKRITLLLCFYREAKARLIVPICGFL